MSQKLLVKLQFSLALRAKWPAKVVTAEAHSETGAWSLRAELWTAPDEEGIAFAWVTFLSPDAPMLQPAGPSAFDVTLGRTTVATCYIQPLPAVTGIRARDADFLEDPKHGLRAA